MGRARRSNCRLCMKPTNRGDSSTINNLPQTFAHILEEISGLKFTEADGLHMTVCFRCRDFLQAMEHHSQYPRSNKISGAGKRKVRRLMDKGLSAAEAIEKVIAEKRARDLLAGTGLPVQGASVIQQQAPAVVQNLNLVPSDNKVRMSGAQRRKMTILIAGGMDRNQARELVLAASRAVASANQFQQGGPVQRGMIQRAPGQRGAVQRLPGQRGAIQRLPGQRGAVAVQRQPGQRGAPQKVAPQNGPAQKGAPQKAAAQNAPVQRATNVKGVPQKAANVPAQKTVVPKNPPAAVAAVPQQKRQTNPSGGRTLNSDKRLGAYVAPRRNDRPAPYNNRGNNRPNQQGQQNDNFNQPAACPLEVGIVPINFPSVQLDDMKLEALKEAITNEIFKIPQGGPLVRFLGTSSQNGWLKLICADELSHNWLARLVSRWERAGVRMVEGNSLPQPVVLSLYLPGDFRSPEEILSILEKQNNSLNTCQWRIINRETDANGQSITVCMDEQSLQALQNRDYMVFLGLGVVEFKPRRFPSGGESYIPPLQGMMGSNNNRSNSGGGNISQGYSNGGSSGGGGMGNNYQANRSNNSGGGGSYQRQNMGQGQGYQRSGNQSQRAW